MATRVADDDSSVVNDEILEFFSPLLRYCIQICRGCLKRICLLQDLLLIKNKHFFFQNKPSSRQEAQLDRSRGTET